MSMTIGTRESEINDLLAQATAHQADLDMKAAGFPKDSSALLDGNDAGLSCISALCECYQELQILFAAVQELSAAEVIMAKNAVATIAEADREAAQKIIEA